MFILILSFLYEVANTTFEFGFYAGVSQVLYHTMVTPKGIWVTATEDAMVRRSLMFCEMSGCIEILERPVAAKSRAVERASFQVVVHRSCDFTTFKNRSASGAR
jgi:hypothetical protein